MTHLHITIASPLPSSRLDWLLASRVALAVSEAYRSAHVRVDVADIPADRFAMRVGPRAVEAPRAALEAIVAETAMGLAAELDASEGWAA